MAAPIHAFQVRNRKNYFLLVSWKSHPTMAKLLRNCFLTKTKAFRYLSDAPRFFLESVWCLKANKTYSLLGTRWKNWTIESILKKLKNDKNSWRIAWLVLMLVNTAVDTCLPPSRILSQRMLPLPCININFLINNQFSNNTHIIVLYLGRFLRIADIYYVTPRNCCFKVSAVVWLPLHTTVVRWWMQSRGEREDWWSHCSYRALKVCCTVSKWSSIVR